MVHPHPSLPRRLRQPRPYIWFIHTTRNTWSVFTDIQLFFYYYHNGFIQRRCVKCLIYFFVGTPKQFIDRMENPFHFLCFKSWFFIYLRIGFFAKQKLISNYWLQTDSINNIIGLQHCCAQFTHHHSKWHKSVDIGLQLKLSSCTR